MFFVALFFFLLGCYSVQSVPAVSRRGLPVVLDDATVFGVDSGLVTKYLGLPYAVPPTGDLRLRKPQPTPPYGGTIDALKFGPMCPNQYPVFDPKTNLGHLADELGEQLWDRLYMGDENCLSINVIIPKSATPNSRLPVAVWIYGGAFSMGDTQQYDGTNLVTRSIEIGYPVIFVSFNYRIAALGFLGGEQVKSEGLGNLGLQDQRLALHWVQKYITAFGGDPSQVTIWGESAGAISAGLQMIMNGGDTEGLFRAAFMQSGSPIPVGDISHGQLQYDELVSSVGCSDAADSLACLRTVDFEVLYKAMNKVPGMYLPRVDGQVLTATPFSLVASGQVARIPFVTGDLDDEGTIFAVPYLGVATDEDFRNYLTAQFFPNCTSGQLDMILDLYPSDPSLGSPYGTGTKHQFSPQFKRIASLEGDVIFQMPRRFFLEHTWDKQKTWNYWSKRDKTSHLGSYHTSDIAYSFGSGPLQEYIIRFVVHMDPNGPPSYPGMIIPWPQYTLTNTETLLMQDEAPQMSVTNDTFRSTQIQYIRQLALQYPL